MRFPGLIAASSFLMFACDAAPAAAASEVTERSPSATRISGAMGRGDCTNHARQRRASTAPAGPMAPVGHAVMQRVDAGRTDLR